MWRTVTIVCFVLCSLCTSTALNQVSARNELVEELNPYDQRENLKTGESENVSVLLVSLPDGQILGYERVSPGNRTFHAFQGIPYATPPLGNLRFQAPQPAKPWDGILNATQESDACFSISSHSPVESEDCLYINVFTPVLNNKTISKLPVLFWSYGGGFTHGSSLYYNMGPDYLVEQDIVVVTFNYRLGPYGFLSSGDEVISGNAGLKDQLLALKWTYKNIGLFGGDSEKITLLGQSAGAASVGYLMLSKKSTGLFRAVIAESGSPLHIWAHMNNPREYAFDLAYQINNITIKNDTTELLNYLVNATTDEINLASTKTVVAVRPLPVTEPEHEDAFITDKNYVLLENGDFNRVPLLTGTTSEEDITRGVDIDVLRGEFERYEKNPSNFIPKDLTVIADVSLGIVGKEIQSLYFDGVKEEEKLGHLIRYYSDDSFSRPVIKHAELQSNYTDVYFYYFAYDGIMGNVSINVTGADKVRHGEESAYFTKMVKPGYDNSQLWQFPESDVLTHKRMVQLWANFAKTMNPTPEKSELFQNIIWPTVKPDQFWYLNIDENLEVKIDPKGKYYKGWKEIYEKWGMKPFTTF